MRKDLFNSILSLVVIIGIVNLIVWALPVYNILAAFDGGEKAPFLYWWQDVVHQYPKLVIFGLGCSVIALLWAMFSKKKLFN